MVGLPPFAPFFGAGPFVGSGSGSGSGCLLFAGFLTAGSLGEDSSGLDRLDLVVSFVTTASSGDESLDAGRLAPRLASFLTAGVLGFVAGAPLLTGVAFTGVWVSFLGGAGFFPRLLAEDTAFLAGDFLARVRPLPLAFDRLGLRDFLAGGGRRALGGGLFGLFLLVI